MIINSSILKKEQATLLAVHRLKEGRDFRKVFRRGRSTATSNFVLYWTPNRDGCFRVGFSVSKKVGNAVERNRLKRLLRECFHRLSKEIVLPNMDFVVVCRVPSKDKTYNVVFDDITKLLRRAKFMV